MSAESPQNPQHQEWPAAGVPRQSWWVRGLSRLPLPVWHAIGSVLAFIAHRVVPYRRRVVDENLRYAFPDIEPRERDVIAGQYYRGFADVLVEIIKGGTFTAEDFRRHVRIRNPELVHEALATGKPVIIMAAHQANWEWLLLASAIELGVPVDAAYKPLRRAWAEREMLALRSRFGTRMVPAKNLVADMMKRRKVQRAIAVLGDQEPRTSEYKYWTRFLNRDTAFYQGGEEIARTTRYPALFAAMRRVSRGCYEVEYMPLSAVGETLAPGEFTERYARLVEQEIHRAPADWPWSHKRWKLRKPLYG